MTIFPTRVGMFRRDSDLSATAFHLPHASGDVPDPALAAVIADESSPREWGCSALLWLPRFRRRIFPTRVGMFRQTRRSTPVRSHLPHASGDVPVARRSQGAHGRIFPTRVGMFRGRTNERQREAHLPHASGDVPDAEITALKSQLSSPREWGCSVVIPAPLGRAFIFPTRVGMFRRSSARPATCEDLPHASGDVPRIRGYHNIGSKSSPREWGCSALLDARYRRR